MPIINVKLVDGAFSPSRKRKIARKVADTLVSIEGEAVRPATWVIVEEVKIGDLAIGGRTLAPECVHAKAGRKAA